MLLRRVPTSPLSERQTEDSLTMPVATVLDNRNLKKSKTPKHVQTKWKTITQERIYGRKLLEAMESTKNQSVPLKISPARAIKEAADSALAVTARGQTRWSRAILLRRWRNRNLMQKAGKKMRRRRKRLENKKAPVPERKGIVTDRLRVLGRLVPGGKKLSAPKLLEEAADYVPALEMQVRVMRALAALLLPEASSSEPNRGIELEN